MKVCYTCEKEKPLTEFGPKKRVCKGVTTITHRETCYECRRILARKKTATMSTEERAAKNDADSKRYYARKVREQATHTPEQRKAKRDRQREVARIWTAANPEKLKISKKRYRAAHAIQIAEKKARDFKTPHGKSLDIARGQRYRAAHSEVLNEKSRMSRTNLTDAYVKTLVFRCRIASSLIPSAIVEATRQMVKIKRELKALK